MSRPYRTRKRQTQLSFTPLPTSSPAAAEASPAVRNRLAHVSYSGSPSPAKRQRIVPPPLASSQQEVSSSTQASQQSPRLSQRPFMSQQAIRHTRRLSAARRNDASSDSSSAETDSDDEIVPGKPLSPPPSAPSSSRSRKSHLVLDSDDDDHDPAKTIRAPQSRIVSQVANNEDNDTDEDDDEDDDDNVLPRRQRLNRAPAASDEESSDHGEEDREDQELREDLDFLSSPTSMVRSSGALSQRQRQQQALENYRRSRQQNNGSSQTTRAAATTQEEMRELEPNDHEEEGENWDEDEDDDDFLDDRNVDEHAPAVALPVRFSSLRTAPPKKLFKHVVEWMVQKKVNPAFSQNDDVYQTAFSRLDHSVKTMGDSGFKSSAWSRRFLSALERKPMLDIVNTAGGPFLRDDCQACNRTGHAATWSATFQGRPYDQNTLEPISDDEEDGDDEDDYTFALGKTCMANARTAHTFAHWRYNLMVWVVDWLRDEAYLTKDAIFSRDSWSTRKKREYANGIVDRMEVEGAIQRLWHDFNATLRRAHRKLDGE